MEHIRVLGRERRPSTVEVVINSGYIHWVGDEKYGEGERISIPEKEYNEAKRKFQLVEGSADEKDEPGGFGDGRKKIIKPNPNKAMTGNEATTESK